ncbi:hypothetical protein FEM48_Zijuj09G0112100 [Ziziphus jujuba var. spinosa]|uniref:Uncharacterized protein n=1 Tax=Ziziphus jujuba var. spinosa TaxID=714518 RepID=A0A978USP0_ZIZJJ|nr:uncharacterized protein LOC107435765 [Ziziphus jujuba var. spinosa]KAH7517890.1 hypothetical protein FEM48_Zijuj09G0112100 [Ziziphus jujuba var. spinosa]
MPPKPFKSNSVPCSRSLVQKYTYAKRKAEQTKKRCKIEDATKFYVPQDQTQKPPSQEQLQVPIKEELDNELVDFRGLSTVSKCFVSVLERACILHPELAVCPGRTSRWRRFAYGTLGELLFLLTSTRQKELTLKSCDYIQNLWEEAKVLGFDLSWLAPSIDNVCLVGQKKHLEQDRETMHSQMSTLTMQLCEAKRVAANLEIQLQMVKGQMKYIEEEFLCTSVFL